MTELKPCPFCGREVKMFGGPEDWTPPARDPDWGGDPYMIICECGATSIEDYNAEKVAYWWNRRAVDKPTPPEWQRTLYRKFTHGRELE